MVSRLPQQLFLFPKSRRLQIHNLLWELFRNRILNQEVFPAWKHPVRRLRMHGMPIRRQPEQILPKNRKHGRKLTAIGILAF